MSLKSSFRALEDAAGSSLIHLCSEFRLSMMIFKAQRASMSFKSLFRVLEDAGGSLLGFGILILIWIWLVSFETLFFQILGLYLDFEDTKNINVPQVLFWAF